MSEATKLSVVALLEEHVELAISTVQELRARKLELEAEIARLSSDLLQRDAQIEEQETRYNELSKIYEREKLSAENERAEIRQRLEDLMAVLANVSETPEVHTESESTDISETTEDAQTDETAEDAEVEIVFTAQRTE